MNETKSRLGQGSLLLAVLTVGLLTNPVAAQSQIIRGRVLESQTSVPIQAAAVMLLDTTFTAVAGTASNTTGAFSLEAPGPGSYYVLTESLGYSSSIDGILELGEGASVTVEIYLKPKPIVLDSLRIAVERAQVFQHLEGAGFNQRSASGFGYFITPEDIQQREPRYVVDLFKDAPGVRLIGGGGFLGTGIQFTNVSIRGAFCDPQVYVDGILVNADTLWGGLEGVVDVSQIAAVELYTRASNVPSQWGGTNAGCGVVLIWTRDEQHPTPVALLSLFPPSIRSVDEGTPLGGDIPTSRIVAQGDPGAGSWALERHRIPRPGKTRSDTQGPDHRGLGFP
jgi:hypothetical protein